MCHELANHERELAYEPDEEVDEGEDLADPDPAVPPADDD